MANNNGNGPRRVTLGNVLSMITSVASVLIGAGLIWVKIETNVATLGQRATEMERRMAAAEAVRDAFSSQLSVISQRLAGIETSQAVVNQKLDETGRRIDRVSAVIVKKFGDQPP